MITRVCMPPAPQPSRDQLTEDEAFQYVLGVMDSDQVALVEERIRGSANIRAQITAVRHLLGTFVTESNAIKGEADATENPGD